MKTFSMLAAGLLALSAMPASAQPQTDDKAGAEGARPVEELPVSRSFLLGSWTDDGDCEHIVEFLGDGRFFGSTGVSGIWQLDGSALTLAADEVLTVQIVPLDNDTMGIIAPDGTVGHSTRCDAPEGLLPGPDETV